MGLLKDFLSAPLFTYTVTEIPVDKAKELGLVKTIEPLKSGFIDIPVKLIESH